MLHKTNGVVLRSVKYGETSIVTTVFTEGLGIQSFMVQGVRSTRSKQNKAGLFQPGTLLDMVVYHQPLKNMQRINQYQAAYLYTSIQEEVVKNSIVLFSVEVLLRVLPEQAPLPDLFNFAFNYFVQLDKMTIADVANFPIYFVMQCSKYLGFDIKGNYSEETPYVSQQEGEFSENPPVLAGDAITTDDAKALSRLMQVEVAEELKSIALHSDTRMRILDWYIAYLQMHTQHMGNIRSLSILRAILH